MDTGYIPKRSCRHDYDMHGHACDITYAAPRKGDIHGSLGDIKRRLEATVDRVATCSLADGLSKTIAWCRDTLE